MGLPHNFGQTQHFDTLVVFAAARWRCRAPATRWSVDALIATARRPPRRTGRRRRVHVANPFRLGGDGVDLLRRRHLEAAALRPGRGFSDNFALLLLRQQYHISDGEPLTMGFVGRPASTRSRTRWRRARCRSRRCFRSRSFSRAARGARAGGLAVLIGIRMLMGPTFEQFMMCYVSGCRGTECSTMRVRMRSICLLAALVLTPTLAISQPPHTRPPDTEIFLAAYAAVESRRRRSPTPRTSPTARATTTSRRSRPTAARCSSPRCAAARRPTSTATTSRRARPAG